MKCSLVLVIPAYNEEARIGKTLATLKILSGTAGVEFRVLVVANGCVDGTVKIAKGHKVDVMKLCQAGKGLAVREGFKYALAHYDADFFGFCDADMMVRPEFIASMALAAVLARDRYDGVIASRYADGACTVPPRPTVRFKGGAFFRRYNKWLLNLAYWDMQCGAKIFTPKCTETLVDKMRFGRWAFDVELLHICAREGFRILEYPVFAIEREGTKLRMVYDGTRMLRDIALLRVRELIG